MPQFLFRARPTLHGELILDCRREVLLKDLTRRLGLLRNTSTAWLSNDVDIIGSGPHPGLRCDHQRLLADLCCDLACRRSGQPAWLLIERDGKQYMLSAIGLGGVCKSDRGGTTSTYTNISHFVSSPSLVPHRRLFLAPWPAHCLKQGFQHELSDGSVLQSET